MAVIEGDGSTWSGAAGRAASDDAMTTEHVLLVGSNTKMLTAAIVLELVEEGALDLDDAAVTWVPELRGDITVRMLLQHQSGIGEYFDHELMTADGGIGATQPWTPEQLIELGKDVSDVGPTEQVHYSNTNYIALGRLVEVISGRPFEEALHDRIFAPLGMESARALRLGGRRGQALRRRARCGAATPLRHPLVLDRVGRGKSTTEARRHGGESRKTPCLRVSVVKTGGFHRLHPGDWVGYDAQGVPTSYGLGIMMFDLQGRHLDGHTGGVDGFTGAALRDAASGQTVVNQDDMERTVVLALEAMEIDLGK